MTIFYVHSALERDQGSLGRECDQIQLGTCLITQKFSQCAAKRAGEFCWESGRVQDQKPRLNVNGQRVLDINLRGRGRSA